MNSDKLLKYLQNKKVYILSPHFDDALLSAGMLLTHLKPNAGVTVINIFTNAHSGPYTLSGKVFLAASGYRDAVKMFEERQKEDEIALKSVNAKIVNLGFPDGLFRRSNKKKFLGKFLPEFDHVYPTYRWHLTRKIATSDVTDIKLKVQFKKFIPEDAVVFSPFGVGNHSDHMITKNTAEEVFKNVIYYLDFPYNIRLNFNTPPPAGYKEVKLAVDLSSKSRLINHYQTQASQLFEKGIMPAHSEVYYVPMQLRI